MCARAQLRALMTQKLCAVGMRNAKLGNHLKLADRSECGWTTVSAYVIDDLANTREDEGRISNAEKLAKKALDSKREKSRVKSSSANYKSNHASFSRVSTVHASALTTLSSPFDRSPFSFDKPHFYPDLSSERNLLRLWIGRTLKKQLPQSHFFKKIR